MTASNFQVHFGDNAQNNEEQKQRPNAAPSTAEEKKPKTPPKSSEQSIKGLNIQIAIDELTSEDSSQQEEENVLQKQRQKEEVILEKLKEGLDIKILLEEEVDQLLILKEIKRKQRIAKMKKIIGRLFALTILGALGFGAWRGYNNKEQVASMLGIEKIVIEKIQVKPENLLPQKI